MQQSVSRMSSLIDNILDFARARLGGGLSVTRQSGQRLEPTLEQVISEIRASQPERIIHGSIDIAGDVDVDHVRLAQLLSNLLGNAIAHGSNEAPIEVSAAIVDGHFELAVTNSGDPIPPEIMEHLFQPFYRGDTRPGQQGLGLGASHCVRDCEGAWRATGREVRGSQNPVHLPNAGRAEGGGEEGAFGSVTPAIRTR